jgi:mono/diheme cytochrome c family protein
MLQSRLKFSLRIRQFFTYGYFWVLAGSLILLFTAPVSAQEESTQLAHKVRELLLDHCSDCHGRETRESGLRLDTRRGLEKGGDFGPVLLAGQPEKSELFLRVVSDNENRSMPPDGDRLEDGEIALLRDWIVRGAPWPESLDPEEDERNPRLDHWAWQPLIPPLIPESIDPWPTVGDHTIEPDRNPIDRFIRARLLAGNFSPSPLADRRTLIRRLYFDLHGLPPSPEEIMTFVNDPDPGAYEKLVDRLLDSPRYGERWARHWLDVVHYGDTHGYDKDQPRPNAWPYRDYVIRAFNEDKPYARFIREQIAGDVLFPETRDGQEAMGMIAAGPWDLIGHLEVPETKTDGKIARHLDRDDMVANTIGTFNSVTIQCAQCHQHKFDPVSQEDYYSLQAVFAAIDRDERQYSTDPEIQRQWVELQQQIGELRQQQEQLSRQLAKRGGDPLQRIDREIAAAERGPAAAQGGYHSKIEASADSSKWVQIDLETPQSIREIVLHPCYDDFNGIGAGFGFPASYRIEVADDPEFLDGVTLISELAAGAFSDPGVTRQNHSADVTARYVRITATQLAHRSGDYIFALAEIEVLSPIGENLALGKPVHSLDSVEAPSRWTRSSVVDGKSPALASSPLSLLREERTNWLKITGLQELNEQLQRTTGELAAARQLQIELPLLDRVYAATAHQRSGLPRTIHLLSRGSVLSPLQEVGPGSLSLLSMLPSRFELPVEHSEGDRRAALADWISDSSNPLTWRSIVNRVWQYHFGLGLVATPDDLGLMGSPPSHPELLDWLAIWFRDNGGSLKNLHRLIVCSATYRQSSAPRRECLELDADNRLLWRCPPRRLEAEAIRDSVLAVAGTLDLSMGGPGWQDFEIKHPEHSPHYLYELADPEDRSLWRRSIYRFVVRSQTQPFMTVLDCADPSMRVDRRNQSISALQALALLNNGLMLVQSREFADRVRREVGDDLTAQIIRAFELALGRRPQQEELAALIQLGQQHNLENVCRGLLNLNEFVWID